MKKLLGTIALFKRLKGAKEQTPTTSTWLDDIQDFIRMMIAVFKGDFQFKKRNVLVILCGMIYIISPVDFLPAALLGPIGLFDDAAIFVFVYNRISKEIERFRKEAKFEDVEVIS